MADRITGTVKWFNDAKAYGFISREGGKDLFVHKNSIRDSGSGQRTLKEGDRVEFTEGQSAKGPEATDVVRLS